MEKEIISHSLDNSKLKRPYEDIVYVLQGGGALGAYQVGIVQALFEHGYYPHHISGISIGAINSAIIAGNPKEKVPEKLDAFWNKISTNMLSDLFIGAEFLNELYNELGSAAALFIGQPGFFSPRFFQYLRKIPIATPWLWQDRPPSDISFYDTSELRSTLEELVDFDRINSKEVTLSLGAVSVDRGELVYFTNTKEKIRPEHVMASAALPPGFPAINIDGDYYWDAGTYSNTPIMGVLGDLVKKNTLCFSINCFNREGPLPSSLDQISGRIKDIRYSSHMKEYYDEFLNQQNLRCAISHLISKLPQEEKDNELVKKIQQLSSPNLINIVKFIYHSNEYEHDNKDYNFSRYAIDSRKNIGYHDAQTFLEGKVWEDEPDDHIGAVVYEAYCKL